MMVILNSDEHATYACDTYFERWAAGSSSSPSSSSSSSPSSSLTQVTLWLCGEFALRKKSDDTDITLGDFDSPIDETNLLGMIDRILTTSDNGKIKSYALTTLAKLYPRCAVASNKELIRKMMKSLDADVNVEIQTRSVEYGKVCGANDSITSATVFAAVPKLEGMGGGDELDLDLDDDDGARDSLDLTALLSLDDEAISVERQERGGSKSVRSRVCRCIFVWARVLTDVLTIVGMVAIMHRCCLCSELARALCLSVVTH